MRLRCPGCAKEASTQTLPPPSNPGATGDWAAVLSTQQAAVADAETMAAERRAASAQAAAAAGGAPLVPPPVALPPFLPPGGWLAGWQALRTGAPQRGGAVGAMLSSARLLCFTRTLPQCPRPRAGGKTQAPTAACRAVPRRAGGDDEFLPPRHDAYVWR